MRDCLGFEGVKPRELSDVIHARRIVSDAPCPPGTPLPEKEARCLRCPIPEYNPRMCHKCPFDLPEDDPCRTCSSRRICEAYHATCGEKQRWTKKQSAASEN